LIEPIFKSDDYDDDATIKNVVHELKGYKGLVIKEQQLRAYHLAGQVYDGTLLSATNVNHEEEKEITRLHLQEKNEFKMAMITNAIKLMGQVDEHSDQLATVLQLQFVEFHKVEDCCYHYMQKYGVDLSKTTFYEYRKEAMFKFPMFYPHELRVKKGDDGKK